SLSLSVCVCQSVMLLSGVARAVTQHCRRTPVLTLFTKFELQEVDITRPENRVWFDRYHQHIPVFHLNGQFLMQHRVNAVLLERRLEEQPITTPN
uniref:Glutaredoxin-like protein n=1 Tax=Sinocyclocheilus anshuiensis TaxID=1608454 RepID=A0A671P0J4_9TELE